MDKERCVFDYGESCKALKEKACIGCSFYKTEDELQAGRDKAAARVAELEPSHRRNICEKYYGGRRAFKDEA